MTKKSEAWLIVGGVLAVFFGFVAVLPAGHGTGAVHAADQAAPGPNEKPSLLGGTAIAAGEALKRAARDPDSLVIEDARGSDDGNILCVRYRGRNGFGGMDRESVAFLGGVAHGSRSFWRSHCDKATIVVTSAVKVGTSL